MRSGVVTATGIVRMEPDGIKLCCKRRCNDTGNGVIPHMERWDRHNHSLKPPVAFVALEGDSVVGYIVGHHTERYGCDGELQYIWVAIEHRGRRIATRLFQLLTHWIQGPGSVTSLRLCATGQRSGPIFLQAFRCRGIELAFARLGRHREDLEGGMPRMGSFNIRKTIG
jgi:hypothetical protein